MTFYIRYRTDTDSGTLGLHFDSAEEAHDFIADIRSGRTVYDFTDDDALFVEDEDGGGH